MKEIASRGPMPAQSGETGTPLAAGRDSIVSHSNRTPRGDMAYDPSEQAIEAAREAFGQPASRAQMRAALIAAHEAEHPPVAEPCDHEAEGAMLYVMARQATGI